MRVIVIGMTWVNFFSIFILCKYCQKLFDVQFGTASHIISVVYHSAIELGYKL